MAELIAMSRIVVCKTTTGITKIGRHKKVHMKKVVEWEKDKMGGRKDRVLDVRKEVEKRKGGKID